MASAFGFAEVGGFFLPSGIHCKSSLLMSLRLLFICLYCLPVFAFSQENTLLTDIRSHREGTAVWWMGHDGWLIKSGDLLIATDLVLEYGGRIEPPPISSAELAQELDISFVTHAHNDHFNKATSKILLEQSNCLFVMPESCLSVAEEIGIPAERIRVAKPRESFEVMNIRVDPIRAIHGNANFAIYYEANLQDCGYLITVGGKRFLQPGDSYLLEDHLFAKDVDVLFFSPTEHNMYIDRSVILIHTLEPSYIFPQHHSTMKYDERDRFWAKGYPAEVRIRLSKALQERYYLPEPGKKYLIR